MSKRNEYGRFQLCIDTESGTATLLLENVNRKDEHWLTLVDQTKPHRPIGYLRLGPISPNSHVFEVVEVRPASGSLLRSQGAGRQGLKTRHEKKETLVGICPVSCLCWRLC